MVLPLSILALIYFTCSRDITGTLFDRGLTTVVATILAAVILSLNLMLVCVSLGT
jgi:manganese transport protein